MKSLSELIKILESHSEVDAVFLTGSHEISAETQSSDIDLVIILTENKTNIRCVYEKIDGIFADIFFFDKYELGKLINQEEVNCSDYPGMLITWIRQSDIKFDKSGILTQLKEKASTIVLNVLENEKNQVLNKISYNFIQNQRYFSATDSAYHEALEIRLMYSIVELLSGFLLLRNEPWRGEKRAIKFIKDKMPEFYSLFAQYQKIYTLEDKMKIYAKMIYIVLPENMKLFDYEEPVAFSGGDNASQDMETQKKFWDELSIKMPGS